MAKQVTVRAKAGGGRGGSFMGQMLPGAFIHGLGWGWDLSK